MRVLLWVPQPPFQYQSGKFLVAVIWNKFTGKFSLPNISITIAPKSLVQVTCILKKGSGFLVCYPQQLFFRLRQTQTRLPSSGSGSDIHLAQLAEPLAAMHPQPVRCAVHAAVTHAER